MEKEKDKKPVKGRAVLVVPAFVLVIYLLLTLSGFIDVESLQLRDNIYLSIIILQLLVLMLPAVFFCKLKGTGYSMKLNLRLFPPTRIWFVVLAFLTLITGSAVIRLAQLNMFGDVAAFTLYDRYIPIASPAVSNILYVIVTFAILPAITEEFVFRSVVITEYNESGYGGICAVLMSSLLFAMLHFDIGQFTVYFYGGIIFAAVTAITRSVAAAMAVHFLNNLYQLFIESYLFSLIKQPENMVFLIFACVLCFLVSLTLLLGETERIYYIYGAAGKPSPDWIKKRKHSGIRTLFEAFMSPTFFICILFYIIVTFGIQRNI